MTAFGIGLLLVLMLGVGSVAALNLLRDESEPTGDAAERRKAPAGASEATQTKEKSEETTAPRPSDKENDAEKEPEPDQGGVQNEMTRSTGGQASGPTPGYNLIQSPDGGLSTEVPPSWGVETGEDSEKEAGPNTWSHHAGEYLFSSITTAPSLEVWYGGEEGSSGAYLVASRTLAQYSDYELTHSFSHASKDEVCVEVGPYGDYESPPLSGKLQTWYGCGADGAATVYTLAAAPEGRECVVALSARIHEEADREAIEHLVDTVEVDCGRVTSGPLPASSASASPSASLESPTPSREASASASRRTTRGASLS